MAKIVFARYGSLGDLHPLLAIAVELDKRGHVNRDRYSAKRAAKELTDLLSDSSYNAKAEEAKRIVRSENGTRTAADAVESALNMKFE